MFLKGICQSVAMGDFCFFLVLCMMSSLQDETSKYRNTNRNTRKIMRDPRGKAWPWLTVKRKCGVTATELNIKCVAKLSKFIISCTSEVFSVSFHPFRRPSKNGAGTYDGRGGLGALRHVKIDE